MLNVIKFKKNTRARAVGESHYLARPQNCEKWLLASSCQPIRLSVRTQLGSHPMDFHKIWYLIIFQKSIEEIQLSLKSGEKRVLCMQTSVHSWHYIAELFLQWIMLQTTVVDKTKTHLFYVQQPFPRISCRLWENVEKCGRAEQVKGDNMIRRMRFACWITKATTTHSEYIILLFHSKNVYANTSQCYIYTYIDYLWYEPSRCAIYQWYILTPS